jgi:glycosyltransferase involved in cell wall biosynthesis
MKLIRLHKPDCIINRYSIYDLSPIIVGKFYRIPIVSEVNGSVIFERDLIKKFYFKGLAKWVEKTIFKQANVVTVVSTGLYDYFEEHEYDVSSTIVIPNGVDIEKFKLDSPAPIILENIVAKWEGKTILGFLGSLKSWHGVERIIDILPILINENKDVRFLIIGDGSERERLEKKINDLELSSYVHITGFLDYKDIPGAINIMDIALAPYHSIDHFHFSPLKVFEYMGMGKPVISPNLGQCSELIETDVNGVLIQENTNEALMQAIVDLVNNENKRKLLGKNAREFIAENYTWKVNAEKISKAIKLKQ